MTRRPSVVPAGLRTLLDRLAAAGATREFYLAGGTGLALLLNHRRSVDLDFFSNTNRLDCEGRRALDRRLRQVPGWSIVHAKDGTLHGRVGRTRVSFFHYGPPSLRPLIRHGRVRIASLEDIGCMKIAAIIGRGARKDFMDLYAISRRIPLRRLLALGRRKFTTSRDFPLQALKALDFFEDAEQEPSIEFSVATWEQVKGFCTREVRALTRRYL